MSFYKEVKLVSKLCTFVVKQYIIYIEDKTKANINAKGKVYMKNRDAQREKIPEKYKDLITQINRIERDLDASFGKPELFLHGESLKRSIPSMYKITRDDRSAYSRYKIEYR